MHLHHLRESLSTIYHKTCCYFDALSPSICHFLIHVFALPLSLRHYPQEKTICCLPYVHLGFYINLFFSPKFMSLVTSAVRFWTFPHYFLIANSQKSFSLMKTPNFSSYFRNPTKLHIRQTHSLSVLCIGACHVTTISCFFSAA